MALAICVVAGLMLRVMAAGGDLWLDEIWSLDLIKPLHNPLAVFWAISHDNNHPLNSLWLALVGQDGDPLTYRALSVFLGTLTIPAAALAAGPRPMAALAGAVIAAVSLPFVHYGSEARGYAGLILFHFLAIAAWERALADGRPRWRWMLGAAIGVGTLFHMTMLAFAGVLGLATIVVRLRAGRRPSAAIADALVLFHPAVRSLVPFTASLVAGVLVVGQFRFGGLGIPAAGDAAAAFGRMVGSTFGFPAGWSTAAAVLVPALGLVVVLAPTSLPPPRRALAFIGLTVLPLVLVVGPFPNMELPRYHMHASSIAVVLVATGFGRLCDHGRGARVAAILLGLAFLASAVDPLATLLKTGRGSYETLAVAMARAVPGGHWEPNNDFWVTPVLERANRRFGLGLAEWRPGSAVCPDFLVIARPAGSPPPDNGTVHSRRSPACTAEFLPFADTEVVGFSGMSWSIFRRADGP